MATETTLIDATPQAAPAGDWYVVLLTATGAITFPISRGKSMLVGRSRRADIPLDDRLASREHARLETSERNEIVVMDLKSANGTRLKGQLIAADTATPVLPGESIEIGSSVLLLLRHRAGMEPRRVWSHQYFEARLAQACREGGVAGNAFGVLRARFDGGVGSERVVPVLLDECGQELLANYSPREYELIVSNEAPERLRDRLVARLTELGIVGRFGVSSFPRDGQSAYALFDRASPDGRREPFAEVDQATAQHVDPPMQEALAFARRIAPSNINVLLQGETGVGKEVMTSNIHRWSSRSGPLLCVNCAGLTEALLESDLFGHEKGSFTGASHKVGLLEAANGGTVLLDEIGELPLALQAKLLRVLQERRVRRVGGLKELALDVRFIAATNRDLEAEAARGAFRQDLFFRLNGATLRVPPLRERRSEIAALAHKFVTEAGREQARSVTISAQALSELERHTWPGNIRELRNVVARAVALCSGSCVEVEHLLFDKRRGGTSEPPHRPPDPPTPPGGLSIAQAGERERIIEALSQCAGNQTTAASKLGMPRRTLVSKLRDYQIPRPRANKAPRSTPAPRSSRP